MANDYDPTADPNAPPVDEVATLRAELARERTIAEQRIGELERKLERSRNALPTHRDPNAVTQNLAVQQSIDALRSALREKERVIDNLTKQVRSLEDRLEDHYQELDVLQRKLDQNDQANQAAAERRFQPQHVSDLAPEPPLTPALTRPEAASAPTRLPQPTRQPPAPRRSVQPASAPGASGGAGRLVIGLVAGLLLGAVAAGGLWWGGLSPQPRPPGAPLWPLSTPAPEPEPIDAAMPPTPMDPTTAAPTTAILNPVPEPEQDPVVGIVQDRGGPPMVALRPGRFRMGSGGVDPNSDTRPAHEVALGAFLIGSHEVSFDEYDRYVRATGARSPQDFDQGRGRRPVTDVSWQEARDYTRWLSTRTGRRYRLPTEAEWEYAARAGTDTAYWWGNTPVQGQAVCFDCGSRWDRIGGAPVGSYLANPFGLYDTAGNVAEWVADCYRPSYRDAPSDGSAVQASGCAERVVRGGSWNTPRRSLRSDRRQSNAPDTRNTMIGFRVARDD